MRTNKCFTLITLLTPAEKVLVLEQLKAAKAKQLALAAYLFKLAEANKPLPENTALSLRFYKAKPASTAETLLRSDFRHITGAVEQQLAMRQFIDKNDYQSGVNQRYHLCKALVERGAFELFSSEVKEAINYYTDREDYANSHLFFNLLKEHENRFEPTTKDNYEALYTQMLQTEGVIIKSFLGQWQQHQTRKAFAETNIKIYKPEFEPAAAPDFSALEAAYNFPYLAFLKAKAKTYTTDIAQRKQALIEAHELLKTIQHPLINLPVERLTNGVNLFTIYCITNQADKGFEIASETEQLIMEHTFDSKMLHIFYFNLCSMKLRFGFINEGVELLNKQAERFYDSPYGIRFRFLKVYQLIFQKRIEDAYKAIPDNFSAAPEDKLYIKLIETIIFYMRGEYDLCLVQIKNIKQNADYNRFSNPTYDFFANALLQIIEAANKKQVSEIKQEIHEYYLAQLNTTNPYLLPVVWLWWHLGDKG
jgi:hypothetical protein